MADTLDIKEMEESGTIRLEVARKTAELTAQVERAFPGFTVAIVRQTKSDTNPQPERRKRPLSWLPALQQVETVLREATAPVHKQDLLEAIHSRGGDVSVNTLSIYLSRYPQFVRH